MNKNTLMKMIFGAALLMFAACTQDELSSPSEGVEGALPEGKYPLQIASVTLTADVDAQPWSAGVPQTRVSENDDLRSSHWDNGDKIKVQIADGTPGTYTYQDGSLTIAEGDAPAYWASKADGQSILAWHTSSGSKTVELNNQTKELAYLLTAQTTANFNESVSLDFRHRHALAKVRVELEGDQADDITDVKIKTYTSCTLGEDGKLKADGTEDFIPMVEASYNGETFWEANVVPEHNIAQVKVNDKEITLDTNTGFRPMVKKINRITLKMKSIVPGDAKKITGEINISDNGNYVVTGECTGQITITGGTPNIYLKNANINVDQGNAINITGGNPTIQVVGKNNSISAGAGAGIFVAKEHTVTIKGSKREDKLTVKGAQGGSGIGAFDDHCGSIDISNVTIEAHGSSDSSEGLSAGIGGAGDYTCGTIKIDNATVHAYGVTAFDRYTPGIGSGYPMSGNPPSIPVVDISDSEIHAHRGGSTADYIGWGNNEAGDTAGNGAITLVGGSSCARSTIHCYTGDTLDKTVRYDSNGMPHASTEIKQSF